MSLEIILLPLAIAAVGAVKAARTQKAPDQRSVTQDAPLTAHEQMALVEVSTRMRDVDLLGAALGDTGANVDRAGDELFVSWPHQRCVFGRNHEGIWSAHFTDDVDVQEASDLIRAVDFAYGRRVQQALVQRLRERAPQAGMEIESETVEEDATVTMVLNVNRSRA